MEQVELVWHYTPWWGVRGIIRSGFIRGDHEYRRNNWNVPIAWFSRNQAMERTAGAGPRDLFYRVGFPADHDDLIDWPNLASNGRAKPGVRYHLEREGRRKGANPKDWCGVVCRGVSVENLPIDMLIRGEWVPVKPEWVMRALENAPEVTQEGTEIFIGDWERGAIHAK